MILFDGDSTSCSRYLPTQFHRTGNVSSSIATILVDRRAVPSSGLGSIYVDITQSAGGFVASASVNSLAIELLGEGQGGATIDGLVVDLQY